MERNEITVKLTIDADGAIKVLQEIESILKNIEQAVQQTDIKVNCSVNGCDLDKIVEQITGVLNEQLKPSIKFM